MRDLATEPRRAYRHLGSENGQAFLGLVADFRAARFAGDVPMSPLSATKVEDTVELDWFISTTCTLKTVVSAFGAGVEAWEDAHRIHLRAIEVDGEVFA